MERGQLGVEGAWRELGADRSSGYTNKDILMNTCVSAPLISTMPIFRAVMIMYNVLSIAM